MRVEFFDDGFDECRLWGDMTASDRHLGGVCLPQFANNMQYASTPISYEKGKRDIFKDSNRECKIEFKEKIERYFSRVD